MGPKVLVLGNCQASPLAGLLRRHGGLDPIPPILLHNAREQDRDAHLRAVDEADLVAAQVTADPFRLPWLGSDAIRDRAPGRVVVWPNIFHLLDQPYLRYLTHPRLGRILGPMEGYHDLRLLRAWLREAFALDWRPEIEEPGFVDRVVSASQASLTAREARCDVSSADLVAAQAGRRPLFFTFNHPRTWLLARVAERVLERWGRGGAIDDASEAEFLGRVVVPSRWIEPGSGGPPYRCFQVDLAPGGRVFPGQLSATTPEQLRARGFACYRHTLASRELIDELVLTPDS